MFTGLTPLNVFGPAGYLLAVVSWASMLVLTVKDLFEVASGPVSPGPLLAVHTVGLPGTYVLFGVTRLRDETQRKTVGWLLLTPPLLIVALFVRAAVIGNSAVGAFLLEPGRSSSIPLPKSSSPPDRPWQTATRQPGRRLPTGPG